MERKGKNLTMGNENEELGEDLAKFMRKIDLDTKSSLKRNI